MTKRTRLRGEEEFKRQVGQRVKELREDKDRRWTQPELARRLGDRHKMRVYRIEQGEVPTRLGLIEELAAAFEMKPIEFLAPILGADDAEALQEEAVRRLHQDMAAAFTTMRDRFRESLGRPALVAFLETAARAGTLMRDEELEVHAKMLSGWIDPGMWRSIDDVFDAMEKEKKR